MASNAVDRDSGPDQEPEPERYIQFFQTFRTAFQNLSITVEQTTADDNNVAIAYVLAGTRRGAFEDAAATGRQITARGMQIARFENGPMGASGGLG